MTNRLGATCWMVVCGIALLISCSGKDEHGAFVPPNDDGGAGGATGNRAGASGRGGAAGAGAHAGSAGSGGTTGSALAPKVEITAPAAAADPNTDDVLIDDQVTVLCKATKSSAAGAVAVDPSSVKIAMLRADGTELKSSAGSLTQNDDEYSASFVLGTVPTGTVTFRCTASDKSSDGNIGSDSLDTFVDHGPEINIIEPEDRSAHNLLAPMAVEFDTAPVLLAKGDKQAAVSKVTLTVYGADIPTTDEGGGKYKASVDFTKKEVFGGASPTGTVPVVLTAVNNRKAPGKATHSVSYSIVVDGTGPVLTLVSPKSQDVAGRASVLKFVATDAGSGLDVNSIVVKLNDTSFAYSASNGKWSVDTTGLFTFQFGAQLLAKGNDTQVLVNINAKDKAGNASIGLAPIYNLDNQPPIVDLDPPNLYEATYSLDKTTKQCSDFFDPLGSKAPNDRETITNYGRFRALVYDTTNTKAGQSQFFFALADRKSVQIFFQYDSASPLLADTDGPMGKPDGICDEIWTGVFPYQKHPTDKPIPYLGPLSLVLPTSPRGSVTYPNPKVDTPSDQPCTGGVESQATHLCLNGASDMTVVIHHGVGKDEPIIYALDPVDNTQNAVCTGTDSDVSAAISKGNGGTAYLGWVCVAARAVDTVGNVGISRPLRICLDNGTDPHRCDGITPPTCTDNCTAPEHFNQIVAHD
jgi:hypothetical protein